MCGIAGLVSDLTEIEPCLGRMQQSMEHRGPDARGIFVDEGVGLAHLRLSIIDLSEKGKQPMISANGRYVIVYNGEVYNFNELRKLLPENLVLKSNTDTEVILELWALMKEKSLVHLRGMFAFSIWDRQENELILVRDHLGVKPVYYSDLGKELIFSSELKGLLASKKVPIVIDQGGLEQYLSIGYCVQPDTLIENVKTLEPGQFLKYKNKKSQLFTYWDLNDTENHKGISEKDAIAEVKYLVESAVAEEMVSDRPLGVFLSGGLDSTCLIAALKNKGVANIRSFSVGIKGSVLNEEDEVMAAVKYYGTDHTQISLDPEEVKSKVKDFILHVDQPSIDGFNTYLVSEATSREVKVAISGLGGDEVFSGYEIDRKILVMLKSPFAKMAKLMFKIRIILPARLRDLVERFYSWSDVNLAYRAKWGRVFSDEEVKILTGNKDPFPVKIILQHAAKSSRDFIQGISKLHLSIFMRSRLLRDSDVMSMRHSLELRVPLIDKRIVEFVWSLPLKMKVKKVDEAIKLNNYERNASYEGHCIKHLLFQAFKNDLPPGFGSRPKKGFKIPIDEWMKTELKNDLRLVMDTDYGILNRRVKMDHYRLWVEGKSNWTKVWSIFILETWFSNVSQIK